MTRTLLRGCRLVATLDGHDRELPSASIAVEDGWITAVGTEPEGPFDETLDCSHFVAVPGFVNTHHHLYQTLTRAFPEAKGQPLFPWLRMLYPIWAGLDEEMIEASTAAGLAELVLSGCTTAADHLYVFPPGSEHFMDAQIRAARGLGVRFHPTRGSMDLSERDGGLPPESVVQPIDVIMADSERVIREYHDPSPGAMVRIGLAPCSPFSVTRDLMVESAALARRFGVRLHTHVAETLDEVAYSREQFGMSPVQFLRSLDWLGPDVWVAHCVHPMENDIPDMAASATAVAHCPTSNMLLGAGLAPVRQFLDAGVTVGLGVDGSASNDANDLRNEMKQALLVSRVRDGAEAMSARQALHLATRGGAACLGRADIGSIEAGKCADILLFDANTLHFAGAQEDLVAGVVLGSALPHTVIINGRTVVRAGELIAGDEEQIVARQNRSAARLMRTYRESRS